MSATETQLAAGTWAVDTTHTSVDFAVKHMMITTVRGRFGNVEGTIAPTAEGSSWTVDVTIDASSIDTRTEQRDTHLRSADFLDVEAYPQLTFTSKEIRGGFEEAGDRFQLPGQLTIHGVSRDVVLHVTFEGGGRDPWGGDRLSFTATTRIDRRDFGLTWNQALEAGGLLVANEVLINIDAQLVKQA